MSTILVSGSINVETTLKVDSFPIAYEPVRYPFFGIASRVAGVGFGVTKALRTLGSDVHLLTLLGDDPTGVVIRQALAAADIPDHDAVAQLTASAQSVVLYTPDGRRQIHTDLKDMQEQTYPPDRFAAALEKCDLAVLTNVNWNRPFLAQAKAAGKPIATDVHTIANLDDDYNADYMAAADILFMSDEKLPLPPDEWARAVQARYGTPLVVIGLGAKGALLAVRDSGKVVVKTAVAPRPIVNTVGAGDALFASFLHVYTQTGAPEMALRHAVVFAGYKIGAASATEGYLSEPELARLVAVLDAGRSLTS